MYYSFCLTEEILSNTSKYLRMKSAEALHTGTSQTGRDRYEPGKNKYEAVLHCVVPVGYAKARRAGTTPRLSQCDCRQSRRRERGLCHFIFVKQAFAPLTRPFIIVVNNSYPVANLRKNTKKHSETQQHSSTQTQC